MKDRHTAEYVKEVENSELIAGSVVGKGAFVRIAEQNNSTRKILRIIAVILLLIAVWNTYCERLIFHIFSPAMDAMVLENSPPTARRAKAQVTARLAEAPACTDTAGRYLIPHEDNRMLSTAMLEHDLTFIICNTVTTTTFASVP